MSNCLEEARLLVNSFAPNLFLKRDLLQVREASSHLRSKAAVQDKTQNVAPFKALNDIGITEQPLIESLNVKKSLSQSLHPLDTTDIDGFMRNQYQNTIVSAIEDAKGQTAKCLDKSSRFKMAKEWESSKKELLEELGYRTIGWDTTENVNAQPTSQMMPKIKAYRSVIEDLAGNRLKGQNLAEAFSRAFHFIQGNDLRLAEIGDCWTMLRSLLAPHEELKKNSLHCRGDKDKSRRLQVSLKRQSKRFLEEQFFNFVEQFVKKAQLKRNEMSDLGTIRAFVSNKMRETKNLDVEWATIYYCVRSGKIDDAIKVADSSMESEDFVNFLMEYKSVESDHASYVSDKRLSRNIKDDYQRRLSKAYGKELDPSLQALYMALGKMKVDVRVLKGIVSTTQDFMWLRLAAIDDDATKESENTLEKLKIVLRKWGPAHFNPTGTNPLLYFQVLLLSQQFEEAIRYLDSFPNFKIEAVHFGCTLYYYGLMEPVETSPQVGFDFEKVLSQFVRQFGSTDPSRFALYYFLLHNEQKLIISMIKFICDSRQLDMLGRNTATGKERGVVDLLPERIANEIISGVAEEFNTAENFRESIRLFDLAGKYGKVLDVVNHQMGLLLTKPGRERKQVSDFAQSVYRQYSSGSTSIIQQCDLYNQKAAYDKMKKILFFFEKVQTEPRRPQEALRTQMDLNIIPFREQDLRGRVQEFSSLEDCIKRNFSDILLTTMKILVELRENLSTRGEQIKMQQMGRCLVNFSGLIPYQMPGNDNRELISLLAKIS